MKTLFDQNTGAFERIIIQEQTNMQIDTKQIITVIVAATVAVAFLFVVIAPAFNVIIPNTTSALVFGLFSALTGFGGSQYGEAAATRRLLSVQGK